MSETTLWQDYSANLLRYPELGFSLDCSRMQIASDYSSSLETEIQRAWKGLESLEAGDIANPDENRMVGHYWLRNPSLAPDALQKGITETLHSLKDFATKVRTGGISSPRGARFENLLIIGIGGSALGPQFIDQALGFQSSLKTFFFDNTDPEGIDSTLAAIIATQGGLSKTLVVVISKSGGTPETRNGMLEAMAAYQAQSLDFGPHTVAITGEGSALDNFAKENDFLMTFPMEDWVGGRTSVMSTVGLVPAALQGVDVDRLLSGAAAMDEKTRIPCIQQNAAMQLALSWHWAGKGKGAKDMVILPYKDSLGLFSKYLQQLVMESLGKEKDLDGNIVHQGIAVYGNKGSTDQHAYVQQLREGVSNFFATFIEVRKGRIAQESIEVDEGVTSADYLQGFLRGTRTALFENQRPSLTISIKEVNAFTVGMLIALFERAVTFYALLVNINAYHQPGVEAGKKAAGSFLKTLRLVKNALSDNPQRAEEIALALQEEPETVYHCLIHLSANHGVLCQQGETPKDDLFSLSL